MNNISHITKIKTTANAIAVPYLKIIFMVVGGISFIKERTDLESSFDSYHIGESRTKGLFWEDRICPKGDLQGIPKVKLLPGVSKTLLNFICIPTTLLNNVVVLQLISLSKML